MVSRELTYYQMSEMTEIGKQEMFAEFGTGLRGNLDTDLKRGSDLRIVNDLGLVDSDMKFAFEATIHFRLTLPYRNILNSAMCPMLQKRKILAPSDVLLPSTPAS